MVCNKGNITKRYPFRSFKSWAPKWWLFDSKDILKIIFEAEKLLNNKKAFFTPASYWNIYKILVKQLLFDEQKKRTYLRNYEFENIVKQLNIMINDKNSENGLIQQMKNKAINIKVKLFRDFKNRNGNLYGAKTLNNLNKAFKCYGKLTNDIRFNALNTNSNSEKYIVNEQQIADALLKEYKGRINFDKSTNQENTMFSNRNRSSKFFSFPYKNMDHNVLKDCNSPILFDQYYDALKDGSKSMLPGPDGLNSFFYSILPKSIAKYAYEARMVESNLFEDLYQEELSSLLFPIPKRTNSSTVLSWEKVVVPEKIRFISLINTDSKAWARCLNSKLSEVLPHVMHKYCFSVKGRNLQQAILLMQYISDPKFFHKNSRITVLKTDFSNAFDSTSQLHVLNYLETLIGNGWLFQQIKYMITNRVMAIKFGNVTSGAIKAKTGVLQGCPLSAGIYTIYMDLLASKINKIINGVQIPGTQSKIKVLHYIDDLSIICNGQEDEINAQKILKNFGFATGSKLNVNKTERLELFRQINTQGKFDKKKIKTTLAKSKLYGLFPFGDGRESSNKQFYEILSVIKKQLNRKKQHNFSLVTKVKIINHMFISKLVYAIPILQITTSHFKKFNSICSKFLWNRMVHVPLKIISLPTEYGGLGLISLENLNFSLKMNFYLKLCNNTTFLLEVKNVLKKYYLDKHIKDSNKVKTTVKKIIPSGCATDRLIHNQVASYRAKTEGYNKLPTFFFNTVKKLFKLPSFGSFIFKLLWGRLPTSYHLRNARKIFNILDECRMCPGGKEETWAHLFLECDSVKTFKLQIENLFGIKVIHDDSPFSPDKWKKSNVNDMILVMIIVFAFWNCRNDVFFCSDKKPAIHYFNNIIKNLFITQKKLFNNKFFKKFQI